MLSKTQTFNDGVVGIYDLGNTASPGNMPVEGLTLKQTLRYHERTVGLARYYTALQANVKINYVLRCPRLRDVSAQDVAIPNDGKQYRITLIQYPEDIEPPVMDLTLEKLAQQYDIYQPEVTEGES
jgi:hypothetical protein